MPASESRAGHVKDVGTLTRLRMLGLILNFSVFYRATFKLLDVNGGFNEDCLSASVEDELGYKLSVKEEPEMSISRTFALKSAGGVKGYNFEVCPSRLKEYVPCIDNVAAIKELQSVSRGENWERHCPTLTERMCCLIAAPITYKVPIRWPKSRDEVWYSNVPHKQLVADKGGQYWIRLEKDRFIFPGCGTQFAHGANQYLDQISKMRPIIEYGRRTRVVLDIRCGVASFGASLFDRDVITLSIAPKDVHENQIQFALERGVPAMIAILATRRLPYPSQVFDLIHCSRCRINWTRDGIESLTSRLCWKQVGKEGQVAVWRKPLNDSCYIDRPIDTGKPSATKRMIQTMYDSRVNCSRSKELLVLKGDRRYWYVIMKGYLRSLGLRKEEFRNVMDMRALYGGFAAAPRRGLVGDECRSNQRTEYFTGDF
ncbi:probable methyltransferase PMT10 isoform X2 [Physcomitrium patens]|uniref:probable methyltransferase PMT10 isoform X2 n=1 Tax=Physcomitrium patens TaxID=3218 RepID=UPI003CCCB469